jgi:hypothetical protein
MLASGSGNGEVCACAATDAMQSIVKETKGKCPD